MMKRLALVCAFCLLSCGSVFALPVGNPSEASLLKNGVFFSPGTCATYDPCFCWCDAWSLRVGFYGDYVFNRNLKIKSRGFEGPGKTIQKTKLSTNAGYLALNICDKLDLFGTLGATHLDIGTNDASWTPLRETAGHLDWKTAFSWSAGARGTLVQWRCFSLGIEGQYFQLQPHLNQYLSIEDGRYNYFINNRGNKMRYSEWQVGTGLSYTLSTYCSNLSVVPYAAVKWSWVRFRTNRFQFTKVETGEEFTIDNMGADKLWGFAIGTTLTFFDRAGLTVEGRFADESAVFVYGSLRF